ncbi:uncharacterized protein LODBEIA_P42710 [Lodderomyces beijingensis]|uniref:Phospholipid/glycerol acyltransferase domain-containing protein n=1 Tax=Lodderomyces beijingensis TaxID=1775926 RepID=A0ABP0ZPI4_9ASCO
MSLQQIAPLAYLRAAIIALTFAIGALCIASFQWICVQLLQSSPSTLYAIISTTKTHFVILLGFLTSIVNPCKIAITIDTQSVPHSQQFKVDSTGHIHTFLDPNSILISNHQIYTDWLFIWFLTYTSNLSNSVFIILKDLSKIPVLGYGMKNFNFLFLSRKWEKDKVKLTNQLLEIDANARGLGPANGVSILSSTEKEIKKWPKGTCSKSKDQAVWPYELILFPEGTVTSDRTTKKSAEYTSGKGLPPLKHVLSPRVRGLYLSLKKLQNTIEEVYDITTVYGGLQPHEYGEIKFSLKNVYLRGQGPPVVNYFIRAYKIKDIPALGAQDDEIDDSTHEQLQEFEKWLLKIWYEKDALIDGFHKTGHWQTDLSTRKIVGDFKLKNPLELVRPFLPIATIVSVLITIGYFVSVLLRSGLAEYPIME